MVRWHEKAVLRLVKTGGVPRHIAFIMDGNRRWAINSGKNKIEGHAFGLHKLIQVIEWCLELGIEVLTVFAFSTDNFKRSHSEVNELMRLFLKAGKTLSKKTSVIHEKGVRVRIVGDLSLFPQEPREALSRLENETAMNGNCVLNLCLGYGGVEEIISAADRARAKYLGGEAKIEDFEAELYVADTVDLLVRTGESRLSNFLLYQSCMTTRLLMLEHVFWPQLSVWHLAYLVFSYQFL